MKLWNTIIKIFRTEHYLRSHLVNSSCFADVLNITLAIILDVHEQDIGNFSNKRKYKNYQQKKFSFRKINISNLLCLVNSDFNFKTITVFKLHRCFPFIKNSDNKLNASKLQIQIFLNLYLTKFSIFEECVKKSTNFLGNYEGAEDIQQYVT